MADIMVAIEGNASSLVSAVGQGTAALGQLEGSATKSGSAIQAAFGVAAIAGATALAGGFAGAVSAASGFERQMSAVSAVSGASASQMQSLTQAALQLGKDTSFSAKEAATGIEELIKAGVSITDVMGGGARAALDLAAAGAVSVGDAAEIAANAMNVFGIAGADMGHVADVIAGAANASAISVTDYKFSLAASGAVASAVGISFESLSTAIALMGQAGIKGADAGTSLKTMMLNLQPSTKAQTKEFQRLGIITAEGANAFFDATGKAKGMAEIAQVLQTSMAGMTKQQQLASLEILFGQDAIRAGVVLMEAGADGFDKMAESMGKVTARAVADERLNNLAGSLEKLGGSAETAAIMFGSLFTPAIKAAVDTATEYLNQAIEIIEQLPDAWRTAGEAFDGAWEPSDTLTPFMNLVGTTAIQVRGLVDVVAGLPEPVKAAGLAFAGVLTIAGPLSSTLGLLRGALMLVGAGLGVLLGPIGLVAAAAAGLAAAWTLNIGGIQEKTAAFVEIVGRYFDGFVVIVQQALTGNVGAAFENLKTMVGMMATELGPLLAQWGAEFLNWIVVAGPPMLAAATQLGADLLAWIGAQVQPIMAQLLVWGQEFVAWVAPQIPPLLAAAATLGAQLLAWIGAQVQPIMQTLLAWGMEFVAWVAPQIPVLLENLGRLYIALYQWTIDQVPGITAELVKWGILFGAWVLTTAVPELIKALPGILNTMIEWSATASVEITKLMVNLGIAVATGIYNGFIDAWKTIGPKIMESIGSIQLPSWLGGGGAPGGGTVSQRGSWDDKAVAAAKKYGLQDPELFAAQLRQESGDYAPDVVSGQRKSESGATGIAQFMPGTAARYAVDPTDPDASIDAAARYMADLQRQYGSQKEAAARYYGAPGANSIDGRHYLNSIESKRPNVRVTAPGQGGAGLADVTQQLRVDQTAWASGIAGAAAICGPYAAALFADFAGRPPTAQEAAQLAVKFGWTPGGGMGQSDQVDDLANAFIQRANPNSSMRVSELRTNDLGVAGRTARAGLNSGAPVGFNTQAHYFVADQFNPDTGAFHVGSTGTTMPGGSEWMTLGQINAVGQGLLGVLTVSGQLGAGITELGATATTGFGTVAQAGVAAGTALVTTSTDALGNMTTIYSDATGVIGATITNAAGQIVNSWGTMTTGVTEQSSAMATSVLTSVTDLGGATMTTTTDMAGNMVTTITDMAGNVTAQYTSMAAGVTTTNAGIVTNSTETSTQVVGQYDLMTTGALTSVTNLGTGTLTTVQDMAGNTVATVTDMQGNVVSQSATLADGVSMNMDDMSVKSTRTVDEMAGTITTTMTDASGRSVTTVTDMAGKVVAQFAVIKSGANTVPPVVKAMGDSWKSLPTPNVSGIVSEFKKIESAANKAKEAVNELGEHTGSKSGSGKSSGLGKKAMGGWTVPNQMTLVGEEGPELISDSRSRYVYTAAETRSIMGGGEIDYDRLAAALKSARSDVNFTQHIDAAPSASEIQRGTERAFRRLATDWDFA